MENRNQIDRFASTEIVKLNPNWSIWLEFGTNIIVQHNISETQFNGSCLPPDNSDAIYSGVGQVIEGWPKTVY